MPSRSTRTEITIPAPPEQVWAALRDLASYPRWNPVLSLSPWGADEPRVGARAWLKIKLIAVPMLVPVVFESTSIERLCWSGGPWGLMRGEHYFELRAVEGGTELVHGENFRGLLVPLLWPLMEPVLEELYTSINDGLAAYVGAAATSDPGRS